MTIDNDQRVNPRRHWKCRATVNINAPNTEAPQYVRQIPRATQKETAAHSSVLAGRIPWTEELGGLLFTWSQRVRHN